MAITQNTFTGDGSTTNYSFTFEYIKQADVKASLDGTVTTAFTLANATTLSFNTAPASGVAIRIFRDTAIDNLKATFSPGSAIKAEDLNDNFTQNNFAVQEADFDVATANTTANTAKTTADTAISTANTASTDASNAVTTANTASTNASAAVSTANTASTNASNAVTTANNAATDAAAAVTTANAATTTANSAVTTANTATTTANSAVTTANAAATDAATAVSTANTASTNASNAVSTANSANTTAGNAVTTANAATTTANSAAADAATAISTANTASTNASNAVTTANSAASDATSAVSTANTASTNASNAVTTANTASTNATAALNNSRESDGQGGFTSAIDKANAAITASNTATSAVSNAVLFDLIANVSNIPSNPSNNDYAEVGDSTGIQNFTPLSGLPSGFVGAAGLTVRLRYDSSATSWVFMNYFANDSETRYVAIGNPNPTYYANQAAFPSATTYHGGVAHSHADGAMYYAHGGNWIKMAKDSDVTTNATNVATKLPLAGGTLTGDLTLSGAPTSNLHAATKAYVDTEVSNLVDSAPSTLDTLNELAAALGDDANFSTTVTNSIAAKMPLAGGTFTGNVDLDDNVKARFGTGDDLEIYHDGSNSKIVDSGTGQLIVQSNQFRILNAAGSENLIDADENGAVTLYYDSSTKLATKSDGVNITGELECDSLDVDGSATFDGDVGIGTSSFGRNLVVNGGSSEGVLQITNNTSGTGVANGLEILSFTSGEAQFLNRENAAMRFDTNNTERMRILSNGHVVIGDSTDTGFFRVTAADGASADQYVGQFENLEATAGQSYGVNIRAGSNSTDHGFRVKNRANDTTQFLVRGDGNVGIGTALPQRALVVSDAGAEGFEFFPGSSDTANTLNHYDRASSSFIDIISQADKHIFGRADGEKMRLDSSGNLLIGSTTGSVHGDRLLQVGSTSRSATYLSIVNSTSGQGALLFADTTTNDTGGYRGQVVYSHADDSMRLWTSAAERARIDSSGRLLVNRTSSTGSGEDIQDSKGGIRSIPQNSRTSAYTLVLSDLGKHISITTGGVTVPSGVFSAGDAVTIYNNSSSDQTITQGSSVTLRSAGTADTGNRTLAQRGICTLLCVASNEFVVSGAGLS